MEKLRRWGPAVEKWLGRVSLFHWLGGGLMSLAVWIAGEPLWRIVFVGLATVAFLAIGWALFAPSLGASKRAKLTPMQRNIGILACVAIPALIAAAYWPVSQRDIPRELAPLAGRPKAPAAPTLGSLEEALLRYGTGKAFHLVCYLERPDSCQRAGEWKEFLEENGRQVIIAETPPGATLPNGTHFYPSEREVKVVIGPDAE